MATRSTRSQPCFNRSPMTSPIDCQPHRSSATVPTAYHASPHGFIAPDGHVMTSTERTEMWRRQGKCTRCGDVVTHTISLLRPPKPLTLDGCVYKGYCLNCHDLRSVKTMLGEGPGPEDDRDDRDSLKFTNAVRKAAATEKAKKVLLMKIRKESKSNDKSEPPSPTAEDSSGHDGMLSERGIMHEVSGHLSLMPGTPPPKARGRWSSRAVVPAVSGENDKVDDGYHFGPDVSRTEQKFSDLVLKDFSPPTTPTRPIATRSRRRRNNNQSHEDIHLQRQKLMDAYTRFKKSSTVSNDSGANLPAPEAMPPPDALETKQ